ncbi:fungal-specific transcription factor domain-containing protein [Paraphoma chrysanthemicola]|uniref:Fungal-specific transcription factor domain-containing protein n=1 Tax=Paraphoma chrysanthemicola TaxID=798071 RepID=A0A8K0QYD8_9PLEO|nr:fungal-specific transcription factor domain-containing protein [Paraphoma chrysanthemicola]
MPTLAQETAVARDLKAKKTKSRNGCGRCKLKRLKCDETAPSCLQCKKRNVSCPGYEKTLKWSTKYEVFSPLQFKCTTPKPKPTQAPFSSTETGKSSLPQNVANGIEALAAVLPAGRKTVLTEEGTKEASPPLPTLPALEEPAQQSSPEDEDSPPEFEPFRMEDLDAMDPVSLDELVDAIPLPHEDMTFDPFDHIDLDSSSFEDIGLDLDDNLYKNESYSSSTSMSTTRRCSREASPRLSRSLLLDFYRLPSPSPNSSSPDDVESLLVQHYFKDVCGVFSSFDSVLNPFRTTIARIYQECPSINYAIQSMAAAHLANTFPNMATIGVQLQQKACDALQTELPFVQSGVTSATKTFLSIMLLGLTTSWHDSSALGLEYLSTARSLILPKLLCRSEEDEVQREAQFFEESLIHWEMLMGFVTDDAMSFSPPSELRPRRVSKQNGPATRRPDGKIVPHPWTGIGPTGQFLLAEVGRLVRRERSLDKDSAFDIRRRQENALNASSLEEDLLALEYPSPDELADTGDERTPKENFIVIAEAYRCAGLLEIYRVFPAILRKRLGNDRFSANSSVDFNFPMPRFETPYEDADIKLWLNSLAMHILRSVESLPSSSGTFCIQPLLLVIAASELQFVSSVDFFDVHANDSKILSARDFVIRRLQEFALRLPNKPLRQMIRLIKETWRLSDEGQDAFWVDVMNEKGWHTIM